MKPFAARNLFVRKFYVEGNQTYFIADPNTQRWIIGNQEVKDVMNIADGHITDKRIAEQLVLPHQHTLDLINTLIDEGIVFQDEDQYLTHRNPIVCDTDIMALHLEITNQCNLRCSHCYLSSGSKKKNELSTQEVMDIIDQLEPGSGKKICLTGGEPMIHPDFFQILEYAAITRRLEVDIYTNATLINEEAASRLKNIKDRAQFDINIQISIEGADARTNDEVRGEGTFDKVGQAINYLIKLGMEKNIVLFVCLTKENISQFNALVKMAEILRIKALKFSQWQKQGRTSDTSWDDKSPVLEDWIHCGHQLLNYPHTETTLLGNFWGELKNDSPFGFSITGRLFPKFICNLNIAPRIDSQGNVWPCQIFVDDSSIVGNTREQSLSKIFKGKEYQDLLNKCAARENQISECGSCQWNSFCGGGCAGFAFAEHADYNTKDSFCFCEIRKYWFEQYVAHKIQLLSQQLAGGATVEPNSTG